MRSSRYVRGRLSVTEKLRRPQVARDGRALVSERIAIERSIAETRIISRHTYVPAAITQMALTLLPGGKLLDDRPIR